MFKGSALLVTRLLASTQGRGSVVREVFADGHSYQSCIHLPEYYGDSATIGFCFYNQTDRFEQSSLPPWGYVGGRSLWCATRHLGSVLIAGGPEGIKRCGG